MASEYYNDYGGRPAKRRRSIVIRVLDLILTIATVASVVLTLYWVIRWRTVRPW